MLFPIGVFAQLSLSHTKSSFIGNYGVSCNGAADGWINLTVSGGATPYSILWSNAATTEDLSGLGAGTYSVVVTDSLGAVDSLSIVLAQPDELSLVLTPADVSCFGAGDGKITSYALGGTPSLSYLWSNSSTEQDLDDIGPGSYSLTVTDANGCTDISDATVVEPPQLNITLFSPVNSMGFNVSAGERDGTINLTVTGGTPEFVYAWSTGAISEDVSELFSGTYSVRVEDRNGCFLIDSITLTSEDSLPAGLVPFTTQGNWLNPNSDFIGSRNASSIVFKTTGAEQMRITPDGNVGIGVNNPGSKLEVQGNSHLIGKLTVDSLSFPADSTNQYKMIGVNSAGQLILFSGLTMHPEWMYPSPVSIPMPCKYLGLHWSTHSDNQQNIHNCPIEGNVGIGTINPSAKLHVNGGALFQGHVGINTNSMDPSSALEIHGITRTCELFIMDPSWCDYVFEENYKLMGIGDLKEFISKNKCLPKVPSAKIIESQGGFDVNQIQKLNLEKIEELHLYIIQLSDQIELLKQKNLELESILVKISK